MAQITFTNAMGSLTAGVTATPYTVPTGKTATIFGMSVANTSSAEGKVTVKVGTVGSTKHIIKDAILPVGSTIIPIGGSQKTVITSNQVIEVTVTNLSTGTVSADVVCSLMLQG